jgi:hypothetical protein
MLACEQLGLESVPDADHTDVRYAHRMHALQSLNTPPYMPYEQYIRLSK